MIEPWFCTKCKVTIDDEADIDWWCWPFCRECGEWLRQNYIADMEREKVEGERDG